MGTKKSVELGLGFEESEYEVSFCLAPRNGDLWHPGTRIRAQIQTPWKVWVDSLKRGGPGTYIPRDKKSMVKLHFIDF